MSETEAHLYAKISALELNMERRIADVNVHLSRMETDVSRNTKLLYLIVGTLISCIVTYFIRHVL